MGYDTDFPKAYCDLTVGVEGCEAISKPLASYPCRYIPDLWVESLARSSEEPLEPSDSDKTVSNMEQAYIDVDRLNGQLVQQLKASDTAFSLGAAPGYAGGPALACVRFGLIRDNTDLNELVELVYQTGKEVEDSSRFLDTMADVVKDAIAKANSDLERESINKLSEEVRNSERLCCYC